MIIFENIYFRFREASTIPSGDYVFFMASTSTCSSPVGKKANTRKHSFRVGACQSFGNVVHELMHMLGKYFYLVYPFSTGVKIANVN